MSEFYASTDEEYYNDGPYDTREQALLNHIYGYDLEEGDTIYIGERDDFVPQVSGDLLISAILDQVDDSCGDWAHGYLENIPDEAAKDLDAKIQDVFAIWAKKWDMEPKFFNIKNAVAHTITEEDIKKSNQDESR